MVIRKPSNDQRGSFSNVTLIAHADWSKDSSKRWVAIGQLDARHRWHILELIKIEQPSLLLPFLKSQTLLPGCIMAGFDFPIGLPVAYSNKTRISSFLSALPFLGKTQWVDFYTPAERPAEISIYRPFYPAKPGNTNRTHLEQALGIPFALLYRLCEVSHENRRSACPLFWTMGAQQVGKAAISGWESLLVPSLNNLHINVKIWPFSGPIKTIALPGNIVVVETYPGEYYYPLGLDFNQPARRSKRRQADRMAFSPQLIHWAKAHDLVLSASMSRKIDDGFGKNANGEDQFDALVGLYGMINVIMGNYPFTEPSSPVITGIEGWIFGQPAPKDGNSGWKIDG